jgi:hypothetical protein
VCFESVFPENAGIQLTPSAIQKFHVPTISSISGTDVTQIAVRLTDMASLRDDVEIEYEAGR